MSLATFGIANTTTIIITQTTTLSGEFSQLSTNVTLNRVSYVTQVSKAGFAYSPQEITVVIGINNTVMWTNMDDTEHTVTSATFDSGKSGTNVSVHFHHTWYLRIHLLFSPRDEGVVVVKSD